MICGNCSFSFFEFYFHKNYPKMIGLQETYGLSIFFPPVSKLMEDTPKTQKLKKLGIM